MPEFVPGHEPSMPSTIVGETQEATDDEALGQALQLVADHHRALGALLGRIGAPPSRAQLHHSPLGRDLRLLAAARAGSPPNEILAAAARVKELMLRPLAADDVAVPAWFWATALGRLVARAERAAHGPDGLLTPATTAAHLGVPPASVDRWLADGSLPSVPGDDGQPLVPRTAIGARLAIARGPIAAEPPVDLLVAEQSLPA
jgi:hypothetical protein